jgi:hypothetical protein
MHNLGDLTTITHDEKLRVAARDHLHGTPNAACRTGNWSTSARRLADLRVLRALRGRRAAQAY